MLNELEELQDGSDEELWDMPRVSFTIQTNQPIDGELVRREYTFGHAEEWGKWTFVEYEERRCDDIDAVSRRNWRRSRKIEWDDSKPLPDVPQEVNKKLKELLGLEELTIQNY